MEVLDRHIFLSTPSARRATPGDSCHVCPARYFYPRPPRGGRQPPARKRATPKKFLSTPSARRATPRNNPRCGGCPISIHALREEGDCIGSLPMLPDSHFYPRPPRGGRLATAGTDDHGRHFYPRPPRGGRRVTSPDARLDRSISIHALREEGDAPRNALSLSYPVISIHALREEGDYDYGNNTAQFLQFLSTPSARRATRSAGRVRRSRSISIHALREEGDQKGAEGRQEHVISIHALREEGDSAMLESSYKPFLISIHALREEGDRPAPSRPCRHPNFYPRPPRGGRPNMHISKIVSLVFLSTPSARRATGCRPAHLGLLQKFLSTPSARRATNTLYSPFVRFSISIHALREEGDLSGL